MGETVQAYTLLHKKDLEYTKKQNCKQSLSILIYFCFYVHTSALEIYDLHKITFDLTNEIKHIFPGIKNTTA